jgi:predicted NBD/HSP70 family sugar kinase
VSQRPADQDANGWAEEAAAGQNVAPESIAARFAQRHSGLGLVRAMSEQRVLEALVRNGPTSRARLARITGLSKPTVSSVVRQLERCGLVKEQGQASGNVGRPSTLYEAVPQAGYVFAVDVGGTKARAGIANPYGEVVASRVAPTAKDGADAFVEQIVGLFRSLTEEAGLEPRLVWGAGVGIPGVYDSELDRVSSAPNLPVLHGFPVAATLEKALGMPVVIENDVNMAAVGERWKGLAQERDHFVAISIGTGIGMGVVMNGELHRGSRGAAGEIDFLPLGADPFQGHRGHGPLEWAGTGPALLDRLEARLADGATSSIERGDDVAAIFRAAEEGDALANELVDLEARLIAMAIAAVSAVVDPDLVVLGGGIGANHVLLEPVRAYVARIFPRPVEIQISALGDGAAFYGALAAGLRVAREELLAQVSGAR